MRSAFRVAAIFVLLLAMNLLWQFPDVPLPLLHETDRLSLLSAWLQPWLFVMVPLLLRLPEQLHAALDGLSVFGASIPIAALFAATSLLIYWGIIRAAGLLPLFRSIGSRILGRVALSIYIPLACIYFASCGYIMYTRFPRVQDVGGNLITLGPNEREQIQRIIASRSDIHKPLYRMTLYPDGYGSCSSIEYRVGDHYFITLYGLVRQPGGIWRLDESTIEQVKVGADD